MLMLVMFQMRTRNRQVGAFWSEAGEVIRMPGKAVEQLFKNLRVEYQNVKRAMHISGCGTDGMPKLHRSTAIFNAFDSYYCLYFPHGGSSVPLLLITENSAQMLSRLIIILHFPDLSPQYVLVVLAFYL